MRTFQEPEQWISTLFHGEGTLRASPRDYRSGKQKQAQQNKRSLLLLMLMSGVRLYVSCFSLTLHIITPPHNQSHYIISQGGEFVVRNFVAVIQDISPAASLVETELFPAGALEYYTKKNMGWDYTDEEYKEWQLAERGGAQGDYRDGMQKKIANVIDCLKTEPLSKRAVIPIPFSLQGSETVDWKDQGENKCCRELHFYLEDGKLKVTGLVRMQNANIFVKNIHFFATLIDHVAKELGVEVGEYTHWITNLCHDRSATSC
jgi:hypothetical protein